MPVTLGRNDVCHCGSGKKYKKCHLEADEKAGRKEREKDALNAAKAMAEKAKEQEKSDKGQPGGDNKPRPPSHDPSKQSWMGRLANKVGFLKTSTQRRTGPSSKGG